MEVGGEDKDKCFVEVGLIHRVCYTWRGSGILGDPEERVMMVADVGVVLTWIEVVDWALRRYYGRVR